MVGLLTGTGTGHPVEQAHHPFDDGEVRAAGPVGEQRGDARRAAEHRVEVAARPAAGQRVVAGIDVVRADLVRGDAQAAGGERGYQPGGHRRLAGAAGRGGENQPGNVDLRPELAHHSMPRCPFCPVSMGWRTLVISVTRSAASSSSRGARRPVTTTC